MIQRNEDDSNGGKDVKGKSNSGTANRSLKSAKSMDITREERV